jgi:hypothetical protein
VRLSGVQERRVVERRSSEGVPGGRDGAVDAALRARGDLGDVHVGRAGCRVLGPRWTGRNLWWSAHCCVGVERRVVVRRMWSSSCQPASVSTAGPMQETQLARQARRRRSGASSLQRLRLVVGTEDAAMTRAANEAAQLEQLDVAHQTKPAGRNSPQIAQLGAMAVLSLQAAVKLGYGVAWKKTQNWRPGCSDIVSLSMVRMQATRQ